MKADLVHVIRAARVELGEVANTYKGTPAAVEKSIADVIQRLDRALAGLKPTMGICPICEKEFKQPITGRIKIYCDDKCRQAAHRKAVARKVSQPAQ